MKLLTQTFLRLLHNQEQDAEFYGSGGVFFEIVVLFYIFCIFAVLCDKFMIPSIQKIKVR